MEEKKIIRELGIQLYTIREFMQNEKDIRESFRKLREYGYTQAQTGGCEIPYRDFGRIVWEEGIEIVGTHVDFDRMVNDFEQALENHRLLNTDNMGIGGMHFGSVDEIKAFIEKANLVGEKAAKEGMKFTYHHHSHEFYCWANGKRTIDMLVEGLDPANTSFVLDTYWIQHAGGSITSWIEKLAGRIDSLHLKDMKRVLTKNPGEAQQQYAEIGGGNMDWDQILTAAKKNGVKYYIVEQDSCFEENCFASARSSIEFLKKYM